MRQGHGISKKEWHRFRRRVRVRAKISGSDTRPRVSLFRSNRTLYSQIIDDTKGVTLCAVHAKEVHGKVKKESGERKGKVAVAYVAGKLLAKKAQDKKIVSVVFDRGGHKYTGRIQAFAEGAREGGLQF